MNNFAISEIAMNVDDVAKAMKLTNKTPRQTILRLASKGALRGTKCGREWRFHRQAVEDFLLTGGAR